MARKNRKFGPVIRWRIVEWIERMISHRDFPEGVNLKTKVPKKRRRS